MSYLDLYRKQVTISGNSGIDNVFKGTEHKINNSFKNSPSYKLIKINEIEEDSIVVTDKNNTKKAYIRPNKIAKKGDVLEIDNEKWIAINCDNSNILYPSYIIQKTNNVITFKDENNSIKTLPCILQSATLYSDGLNESKFIIFPDDEIQILVQYNNYTKKFLINQRFIFNHNKVFKITSFDEYTFMDLKNDSLEGVLKIHLVRDEETELDNFKTNIAYNKTEIIQPTPTGALILQGADSILLNKQSNYTVAYDNGSAMNLTFDWLMELDYTLANVTTYDTVSCTVKANNLNTGVVRLVARCRENNTITVTKDITIKKTLW